MATSTGIFSGPVDDDDLPNFDLLVSHLLASKRSLSCVEYVSQANDFVTKTRRALELHTVMSARISFLRMGCVAQIRALEYLRNHMRSVSLDSAADFSKVMKSLDDADAQLRDVVGQLKSTEVEPSLRPEQEEPKTLIDFVDESGPQNLLCTIKDTIDNLSQGRSDLDRAVDTLEAEIAQVLEMVLPAEGSPEAGVGTTEPDSGALRGMEDAAQDMANNLESLVRHFDLCVTAIKHTEGGGAAASGIIGDLPKGMDLHLSQMGGTADPITDGERREMLVVLQKDAEEVVDVVTDIKERVSDIEALFEQVVEHGDCLGKALAKGSAALILLEGVGNKLSNYIAQSQVFLYRWEEDKAKVEQQLAELEGLREFYAAFLLAYDELIVEVGRRKDTDNRVHRVWQQALTEVEDILKEERLERDYFRQAQGEFLPVDIWPGLSAQPPQYSIEAVGGEKNRTPGVSSSIIKKAIRRAEMQRQKYRADSNQSAIDR
ncbi:MAG: autophagy protein 17 [Stictis urceolatum]|nr:autophagy protein 17 [Stictis urceolata]